MPQHGGDDRPQPQRLLAHRVEVVLVAVPESLPRLGVVREPLERPAQRGRGRLVAGDEQRQQLVAQRRGRPCRVRAQQHREDVLALVQVRSVRRRAISSLSSASTGERMRFTRAGDHPLAGEHDEHQPPRVAHPVEQLREQRAQALVARAEDRAHDDLERQRLHPRAGRDRLARRPRRDLGLGDLADQLAVGLHPLAVERRQQRLALGACGRGRRAAAPSARRAAAEDLVALARVEHVRVAGEDRLDVVGVRDHDPRRVPFDVQRERVAVALAQPPRVRPGPR